jgi:hypothetical protein
VFDLFFFSTGVANADLCALYSLINDKNRHVKILIDVAGG